MPGPLITLLTDFGTRDHYVASMKGAILSINPTVRIVDISHQIAPFQILEAAYTLSQAWLNFPTGTIHIVVVDPGVGSTRRPILVKAAGHIFIGPDNGVFSLVLDRLPEYAATEITNPRYFARQPGRTFHGRDIFAPVATHLSAGAAIQEIGKRINDLHFLDSIRPLELSPRHWTGMILSVDRYGNLITNFPSDEFPITPEKSYVLKLGGSSVCRHHPYYDAAAPGTPFMIHGSSGYLEVSLNQADAAAQLGIEAGRTVELRLL